MDWVGWDLKVIQFQQDRDTSQQTRLLQAAPSLTLNTPRDGASCARLLNTKRKEFIPNVGSKRSKPALLQLEALSSHCMPL